VDFWAEWCGPCKVLGPVLERLAEEGGGSWQLAKVDVDANQQLAMQFGVQGIPTVVAFKDGEPVDRFTGALAEEQVRAFVAGLAPSELELAAERGFEALDLDDEVGAEQIWRAVLERDPSHELAITGLAGLMMDRGDNDGALELLARAAPTEAIRQLQAAARLSTAGDLESLEGTASTGDTQAVIAYGKALAAAGRHEEALEQLLDVVARREEELSDEARMVVLDLFELLGPESEVTKSFRRRLASVLF
jgi:putative thioredoxin